MIPLKNFHSCLNFDVFSLFLGSLSNQEINI